MSQYIKIGGLRGEYFKAHQKEALYSFVGQPLLSLWNRVAYSETVVNTGGAAPVQVQVTTAFVSAFAGILLLSELIKDAAPELRKYKVNNSYQQQLLGIPAGGTFMHQREPQVGAFAIHRTGGLSTLKNTINFSAS